MVCYYALLLCRNVTINPQDNNMEAINPKNQTTVNRAIQCLEKYKRADILRNVADGEGNEKEFNKHERECEKTFNKYLDYISELPKNQVNAIEKSELY